jgi:hypothetical protein
MNKSITIVVYNRNFLRSDWRQDLDVAKIQRLAEELNRELKQFDWQVDFLVDDSQSVDVRGYGDLLNAVRLRATGSAHSNPCLGHVIGPSSACDPIADIKRGINRIIFAPETIEPESAYKKVCHNCGCGC